MNNFREVLNALNVLADTNSNNDKRILLDNYTKSNLFKRVCVAALSPHLNYHISKLVDVPISNITENTDEIFNHLESMSDATGATHLDRDVLTLISSVNSSAFEIVNRIVKKDLKCGVSSKTINKVVPGLIMEWPYMRCHSFTEKNMERINYPAQVEEKCDGTHIDVIVKDGQVFYKSRKGRPIELFGLLDEHFSNVENDVVFIGEGQVIDDDGNYLPRKIGNGIINKAIKGTITKEEASKVCLTLWDIVPYDQFINGKCNFPQKIRFQSLLALFPNSMSSMIEIVRHRIIFDKKEAMGFYNDIREEGGEGAIVKNFNGVFKNNTSPDQVKIKSEYEAEFEIIDWKFGKAGTKYENNLGAIKICSSDKKVVCWVGSGFSDTDRETLSGYELIGSLCTVRFESLIKSKSKDTYSLYLPRFVELREDRNNANSLHYILELTNNA